METASTPRMDTVTLEMRKNSQDFRLLRAKMIGEMIGHAKLHDDVPEHRRTSSHSHNADVCPNLKVVKKDTSGI